MPDRILIQGKPYEVLEWDQRDPDTDGHGTAEWTLYARSVEDQGQPDGVRDAYAVGAKALADYGTSPYGDLRLDAERASAKVVTALREAGLLHAPAELRDTLLALRAQWDARRTRVADIRKATGGHVNLIASTEHDVYARVLRELDQLLTSLEAIS